MTSMISGVSIAGLYLVMGTVVHADDFGSLSQMLVLNLIRVFSRKMISV